MATKHLIDGIGEVTVESVGNAYCSMVHVHYRDAHGRYRGAGFEVLVDEELNPKLSRTHAGLQVLEPEGNLQTCLDLARDFVASDRSKLFFMTFGRVQTDLSTLKRERSNRESWSRPHEHLTPRIKQLERMHAVLRDWADSSDAPLPVQLGPTAAAPFGFELSPFSAGALNRALGSGEVASFRNDAIHTPVAMVAEFAAEAGHGTVKFSFRNDPYDRSSAVFRIPNAEPRDFWAASPMSLDEQITRKKVSDDDLVVLEVTSPVRFRAASFLKNLTTKGLDPVTVVFDASTVHVGKASELLLAFQARPSVDDLLHEVERRLAQEDDIGLDRYVSIIEKVAGLYGMDPGEAFEAFRTQRGDRYLVTEAKALPSP